MHTHATPHTLAYRLNIRDSTTHGTIMYVPPRTHRHSDSDETLPPGPVAMPEVAYV